VSDRDERAHPGHPAPRRPEPTQNPSPLLESSRTTASPKGSTLLTCTTTITERTARRIRDLYDRLWDTQPPRATPAQRQAAAMARAHASEHRWAAPLAWDDIDTDRRPHCDPDIRSGQANVEHLDEIAVERAVAGDGVRLGDLTCAEQAEVVHRLTERGTSIRDIADQLATATRTVSRRRESAASAA